MLPTTHLNPHQYVTPLRVKDVYGHWLYISQKHFDNPTRILIPICRKDGLRRTYTQASKDGQNVLHRANIAEVRTSTASAAPAPAETTQAGTVGPVWHAYNPETGKNDIQILMPQRTDWSKLSDNHST